MAVTLEPLYDRIVVRRKAGTGMSSGRGGVQLHLPEGSEEKAMEAVVLQVGPGERLPDGGVGCPTVEIGDRVLIGKHSGTDFTLGEENYTILREAEILLVIRDEDDDIDLNVSAREIGDDLGAV